MKFISSAKKYIIAHKILSTIGALVIVGIGYYSYKKIFPTVVVPTYTLAIAHTGSLTQTVSGTGQVSASNQLDVTSQVSGTINGISVKVGDHVKAGQLLATIDDHDAAITLANAKLAYQKLVQPAKEGDVTNAQNNLSKTYSDAFQSVSDTFIHVPTVLSGLKDLYYSRNGYLSEGAATTFSETEKTYRANAGISYDKASNDYAIIINEYKGLTKDSSTSQIEDILSKTYVFAGEVSDALKNAQTAVTFLAISEPDYNTSGASTAAANITSWSSEINGDVSSLLSGSNSITSSKNSLDTLLTGADTLDVQSQTLSLKQAQDTYDKYFIRAPFDGIVGRIPVNIYGQAGGSTVIATIVGDQKIAVISLNEVDAAKVTAGQQVNITFDAIDGLNATGTVLEVDQVGAVTQGVVSYGVKITIDTSDPRIRPGMSVNTTIITKQKTNVLVVPTSAIKSRGTTKYVEVLDQTATGSTTAGRGNYRGGNATSTAFASSTRQGRSGMATSTARTFPAGGIVPATTVSSSATPRQIIVTAGDSDDTNTEITSGITPGQLVITKTTTTGTTATAAPSILNTIGGNRTGAAARPAAAGAARTTGTFGR